MSQPDAPGRSAVRATVFIPVYNGVGDHLEETLAALFAQRPPFEWNVLAIDSGSSDRSVGVLEEFAAREPRLTVKQIPNSEFSHGRTRQQAAELADGEFVVYLSQDAVPEGEHWLERMIAAFSVADNVVGVLGRQVPRPGCFPLQKRDILTAFAAQGVDHTYTVYNGESLDLGRAKFYSDVCSAARRSTLLGDVPYRDVAYAEDQAFGTDLIEAGYVKVYAGAAAVIHSNDIALRDYKRRILDEWAGLESTGITLGHPGRKWLLRELTVVTARDIVFTLRDSQYTWKQKVRYVLTAPAYRYSRWKGMVLAYEGAHHHSLEARKRS
ncbi:glycosyltransferase family A protein [Xylanimonas protaetiae]|uniref:Glycosyltransferase family 2 protein n=1 Tax=Xylanimonas protaetiae TaxID=2509457 RepID=A0A4P6F124_9MICO|nr:glycosyltransferase family A protein [Xylanimonas protaetiae]QAY68906.1 glycosyltransferase family 2 protein [Xylanimonas protaetiae]